MAPMPVARAGPIRTAKTPKRVRFAGEDRDQTRLIRQQEAEKRDARSLPRVDVDVTTSYELPVVSAAAEAILSIVKSTAESAKSRFGSMVEYGKSALTTSFTTSFGKINLGLSDKGQEPQTPQQQASMLEYPPFLAGATPNVVKKNRRDYYQSLGVTASMQKARSYAPDSAPARTPEHMQSEKEKIWYRFHETPYAGHKLDFGRGRSHSSLRHPSRPDNRFESPTRSGSKRKTPKSSKSSAKKQQKSAMKKRSKPSIGEIVPRRSNAEEFHANFSGRERNELYASYTRFLTAIRFDVKHFATSLRDLRLPTDTIIKINENMKRSDWDFFIRIMADEEYWGQVKGVGSTKVPVIPYYVESPSKRQNVFPCEYCKPYEWAGKPEVREVENEGDEVPVRGHTKFDEPYTLEEQDHIDAGRFYKVFHRFCHESRYDWKFPDPSRPCSWEGPNHPDADEQPWSISKYDPRLRHFPLFMQKMPKRVRQIQQDLHDTVRNLTTQDRAAWLYIQGIRRHNTSMATLLERMDLERKRRQVLWPCQMQVQVQVKNKPEPEPEPEPEAEPELEEPTKVVSKRIHDIEGGENATEADRTKRARFHVELTGPIDNSKADNGKRNRSEDIDMEIIHKDKRAHIGKPRSRTPPGSFGLFSDDETEDDEKTEKEKEREKAKLAIKELDKALVPQPQKEPEQPKLTWLEKLDATMKLREAELAAQEALEAERAKAEAEKAAAKPPTPKQTESAPSILANKPLFPAAPTSVPPAAPHKPFVFEDPSPAQEQTKPTDDGRNPLKEHTNGVKPVPNLFGSAVPNLAPTGFSIGQNNIFSPLKSGGATASNIFGSNKSGSTNLAGNEENIPSNAVAAPAPVPAPTVAAPVGSAAPVPSLFAPKPPTAPTSTAPAPLFSFPSSTAAPAPANSLFPVSATAAPAAPPAVSENKPQFLFGKPTEVKKSNEANAAPNAPASSIFSGLASAAPAPAAFNFGATTTQAAPAQAAPTSTLFPKAPEAVPSIFQKPTPAATTNIFAKSAENGKPAEPVSKGFFPKPAETAPTPNIFGQIGGVSAAPVTTAASTTSGLFGMTSTAPPVATSAAPTSGLFGATPNPTASAPTIGLFGSTSTAQTTAAATTTSGIFGTLPAPAPAPAPAEASKTSFTFGSNTSSAAPTIDFTAKPAAPSTFSFTGGAKPATTAPATQFSFSGAPKPSEPSAPSGVVSSTPFSFSGATKPTPFSFTGGTKPTESSGTTTPSVFASAAPTTTAPSASTSFPTTSGSFVFGSNAPAPSANLTQSFPPSTPQTQPPSMLFAGFKGQELPTKHSPGTKFNNEDISMASPEQSPEKPSPKNGLFGNTTNGMANGISGGLFGQNKTFFPSSAPAAPSPLKFTFGGNTPPTTAAPAVSFGTTVSQPPTSMPATTAPLTSGPAKFDFGSFTSIPGAPGPSTVAPPPAAQAPAATFQFDAGGLDFSLQGSSTPRKFATPRPRRGNKR